MDPQCDEVTDLPSMTEAVLSALCMSSMLWGGTEQDLQFIRSQLVYDALRGPSVVLQLPLADTAAQYSVFKACRFLRTCRDCT